MKRTFIALTLLFCGCNFAEKKSNEFVEETVESTESNMNLDYQNSLDLYMLRYKQQLIKLKDTTIISEYVKFNNTFINCLNYVDSLRVEMGLLGKKNIENSELINDIFVKQGIADSLFYKIKLSYSLGESIVKLDFDKNEIRNARIKILNEPNTMQMKKQLFGLNNPLGVSMILYGYEVELFKMGNIALKE